MRSFLQVIILTCQPQQGSPEKSGKDLMDFGGQLTFWTARLAMFLYLLGLAVRLLHVRGRLNLARSMWTAGFAVFLLHVACAFHFAHHWSHADAYAATGRRTAEFIGVDWGGGLYFNYAFMLVWSADVCWYWLALRAYETRPWAVAGGVHVFMAFMAFQATVVFAGGLVRLAVSGGVAAAGDDHGVGEPKPPRSWLRCARRA